MKRKIITIAVSVFLALSCQTGMIANASNYSHIIDNDPIASGFGYTYTSNMTYYSASGSYNNDMRLSSVLSSGSYVKVTYTYPQISVSNPQYFKLGVYLNNINFTDENAWYHYEFYPTCIASVGYINQNTAAGDWNYLYVFSLVNDFKSSAVEGTGSHNYNQRFGSDAVKATVYY